VHAHVNFPEYDSDRDAVIQRALDASVWMINVGTTLQASREIVALSDKYPEGVYSIVGLHPVHVRYKTDDMASKTHYSHDYYEDFDYASFEDLVAHPKTVGVGECGIDIYRLPEGIDAAEVLRKQEEAFRKQIELAVKYDKPIMIHARESYGKILEILDDCLITYGSKLRGDAHFFVGTTDEAQAFLDRGFTVSFTGVVTFAKQYKELVEYVPLDQMLSETDCPFVAPAPFRGQRNEPFYVTEVVRKIAEIKNEDVEVVRKALVSNAVRMFNLDSRA
jgi:TatD DNase family protein